MRGGWAIIADDFTGAADAAVQFALRGGPALLPAAASPDRIRACFPRTIAVDTDSRHLDPAEAAQLAGRSARSLLDAGYGRLFKKVDSTLRGNPAAEISAIMRAGGYGFAVLAPAAPRNGRTVRDGVCRIRGTPVPGPGIAALMDAAFPGQAEEIPLPCVRGGAAELATRVREGLGRGSKIFVPDSETMDDLGNIAALADLPGILFAGSSGLAEALAETSAGPMACAMAGPSGGPSADLRRKSMPPTPRLPAGEILFAIGSLTELSAAQCRRLAAHGDAGEIAIDSKAALDHPETEASRILALAAGLDPAKPLLLKTDGIVDGTRSGADLALSMCIGRAVRGIAETRSIGLVFASGGDTAARIVERLEAECFEIVGEVAPGIPWGFLESASLGRRIGLVTKSGGFGEEGALLECLKRISTPGRA